MISGEFGLWWITLTEEVEKLGESSTHGVKNEVRPENRSEKIEEGVVGKGI